MTLERTESLVSVYSSPLKFDADFVKSMLADESIPSSVENSTAPFPGISASPCEVFVAAEHESAARQIITDFEARRRQTAEQDDLEDKEDDSNSSIRAR
jgi:hypothetical protein